MARRTQIQEFPFVEGVHQEIDSKLLPDGYLSACKNVRLRKDGRFGVRADFDAIGNDTATSTDFVPRDLVGFGDALTALGDPVGIASDTAIWDVANYTGATPSEWEPSAGAGVDVSSALRISSASNLRTFAAYTPGNVLASSSVTRIDCAAAGGIVCLAYASSATCYFDFFRASTGATIYKTSLSGTKPRVVAVGTTFFLVAFTAASGLLLSKYDPTTDAAASSLTAPISAALNCFDVVPRRSGSGFWIVYNRTTPTTAIVAYDSAGAAGSVITGPASAFSHVTVTETANRVHLVAVTSAPVTSLYSYTLAGALSTGPTATSVAVDNAQPSAVDSTYSGTEEVTLYLDRAGTLSAQSFEALTHATAGVTSLASATLGAKALVAGTPNYHGIVGGVAIDGSFFSSFLQHVVPSEPLTPPLTVGALINKFAAAVVSTDHIPKIARDSSTGKLYWPTLTVDDQSVSRPRVTEFDFLSSGRRQTAQIAGLLYIGGGALGVFDTRLVYQAGYLLKPRITSAVGSNGAGSLPSSVDLLAAITFEARDALGNLHESDVSAVSTVTMGAADDTITLAYRGSLGLTIPDAVAVSYRSVSGVNQLRRAETATSSPVTQLLADATIRTRGVIYTQAARGALSGTLPHEAPFPADYVWKWGDRLLTANADGAQVSKSVFPGEPVNWSGAVGFTIPKISERIKGVAALDQRGFLFTGERIYWFAGEGPNDLGEGRYSEPLPLPSSTGLEDWRSLVETPLGLFFQGSNGQLWLLPRDGSAPIWIGQPVRDTLVSYPVVTSATLVTEEQLVSFTCNNTGLTDARIVSFDLRAKTWIVDEFASSTPIVSACSYQGRLAMISAGVVYTEKTSLTPNTFIEHGLTTGTINAFGSGWGKYCRFGLVGEYRGDCDLYARISYDDGKSFTTLSKIHQLRSASYAVGDTVDVEWTPTRWKAQSIRLDFSARTPGSATEGFVFNNAWVETLKEAGVGRKASTYRG